MKLTFFFVLILASFSAMADGPCGNKTSCVERPSLTSYLTGDGIFYAKGTGRNCSDAFEDAKELMASKFNHLQCDGSIKCGTNGGVFKLNQACLRNKRTGVVSVWAVCEDVKTRWSTKPTPRNKCALVGGVLMC